METQPSKIMKETPQQPELTPEDHKVIDKICDDYSDDLYAWVASGVERGILHERARIIERAKTICETLRNADPKIFPTLIIRAEAIEDFIDATFGIKIRKQ